MGLGLGLGSGLGLGLGFGFGFEQVRWPEQQPRRGAVGVGCGGVE